MEESMKADVMATRAAKFKDSKSYIAKDGRHVLHGADWTSRKRELWERCGGRCEVWLEIIGIPAFRCQAEAQDPHHIIARSKQRNDELSNLKAVCRRHHEMLDERQPRWTKRTAA
jgi:hypothetical protein